MKQLLFSLLLISSLIALPAEARHYDRGGHGFQNGQSIDRGFARGGRGGFNRGGRSNFRGGGRRGTVVNNYYGGRRSRRNNNYIGFGYSAFPTYYGAYNPCIYPAPVPGVVGLPFISLSF